MSSNPTPPITVYIEYCTACGLYNEYGVLSSLLEKAIPNIKIIANRNPPRMSAFEVELDDGTLIYSKINTKLLPNHNDIVNAIKQHVQNNNNNKPVVIRTSNRRPNESLFESSVLFRSIVISAVVIIPFVIARMWINKSKIQ